MPRYLIAIGAAWGGQTTGSHRTEDPLYDLPRFALAEVAWHLLRGLSAPSLKEGRFYFAALAD